MRRTAKALAVVLCELPFDDRCALAAARTAGMYSARQPAITALIATCSAVTVISRVGDRSHDNRRDAGPPSSRKRANLLRRGRDNGQAVRPSRRS